jgi:hypothetical protein
VVAADKNKKTGYPVAWHNQNKQKHSIVMKEDHRTLHAGTLDIIR